jgi:hypothetical protein
MPLEKRMGGYAGDGAQEREFKRSHLLKTDFLSHPWIISFTFSLLMKATAFGKDCLVGELRQSP